MNSKIILKLVTAFVRLAHVAAHPIIPVWEDASTFLGPPQNDIINVVYVVHGLMQEPARVQGLTTKFENRADVLVFTPTHHTKSGDFFASGRHLRDIMTNDIKNLLEISIYPIETTFKISCVGFSLGGPALMSAIVGPGRDQPGVAEFIESRPRVGFRSFMSLCSPMHGMMPAVTLATKINAKLWSTKQILRKLSAKLQLDRSSDYKTLRHNYESFQNSRFAFESGRQYAFAAIHQHRIPGLNDLSIEHRKWSSIDNLTDLLIKAEGQHPHEMHDDIVGLAHALRVGQLKDLESFVIATNHKNSDLMVKSTHNEKVNFKYSGKVPSTYHKRWNMSSEGHLFVSQNHPDGIRRGVLIMTNTLPDGKPLPEGNPKKEYTHNPETVCDNGQAVNSILCNVEQVPRPENRSSVKYNPSSGLLEVSFRQQDVPEHEFCFSWLAFKSACQTMYGSTRIELLEKSQPSHSIELNSGGSMMGGKYNPARGFLDAVIISPWREMGDSRDGVEFLQALMQYAHAAQQNRKPIDQIKALLSEAESTYPKPSRSRILRWILRSRPSSHRPVAVTLRV